MMIKLRKFSAEETLFAVMLITMLAFHDISGFMLVFQPTCFLMELYICRGKLPNGELLSTYCGWKAIFVFFALASWFWAENTKTIISCVISVCQVTMVGATTILFCRDKEKLDFAVSVTIVAATVLVLRMLILVPASAWGTASRVGNYLGYGNTGLTYILSMIAVFAAYKGFQTKKKFYFLLFGLFTLLSILSGSKKAIFLLVILVAGYMLLLPSNNRQRLVWWGVSALCLVLVCYLVMNNDALYSVIGRRIESMMAVFSGGEADKSTSTRMDYLTQAVGMFFDHPIAGIGMDGFRYHNDRVCWAENNYAEMLADLGIVGFGIYYSLPFAAAIATLSQVKKRNDWTIFCLILFASLAFVDFTMVTYSHDALQFYFVLAIIGLKFNSGVQFTVWNRHEILK